jgi:hypothetical protein
MTAFVVKCLVIRIYAFGTLLTITQVGKPCKPTTPGAAATVVAINTVLIVAMIVWWRA